MRLSLGLLLLWTSTAFAYPEMVRHGYAQCTACHISPAGGGILSSYGRQLSADLMSTWSYTGEANFLHSEAGAKLAEKGFLFGGDIREVQTRLKDQTQIDGKLFLMQANFDTAYQVEHFTGVVSVGQIEDPVGPGLKGNFDATMYYGYFKFTDEIGLRAGRFVPAFGINLPDHTTVIKQGLGFDPTLQFDSVEASFLTENWTVLGTAAKAVDNTMRGEQETVRTLSVNYSFLNRYRVGVGYWGGKGLELDRHIVNANAILGFTSRLYSMVEWDYQFERLANSDFGLAQIGYEVYKGITPYLQFQQQQLVLSDTSTLARYYGAGFHFYPRPHLELSAEWDRVKTSVEWIDSAYAMAHYYF